MLSPFRLELDIFWKTVLSRAKDLLNIKVEYIILQLSPEVLTAFTAAVKMALCNM